MWKKFASFLSSTKKDAHKRIFFSFFLPHAVVVTLFSSSCSNTLGLLFVDEQSSMLLLLCIVYWQRTHCMWSRVYVMVRCLSLCPSVYLSRCPTAAACGGFAAVGTAGRRY